MNISATVFQVVIFVPILGSWPEIEVSLPNSNVDTTVTVSTDTEGLSLNQNLILQYGDFISVPLSPAATPEEVNSVF